MSRLRASLALASLLLLAGCAATDKALVANAAAAYKYEELDYEHVCVETKGPTTCKARQLALQEAKRQLVIADAVLHVGKLPPREKKELKKALKAVQP